jgi:hypothetical protein
MLRLAPAKDGLGSLSDELDPQDLAAAPDYFAGLSLLISLNQCEFEASLHGGRSVGDDLGPALRNIHDLALAGRQAVDCDPRRLVPDPSHLTFFFYGLHVTAPGSRLAILSAFASRRM